MNVIPYGHQDISEQDISAVTAVLRGDMLTQGPTVDRFETAFATYIGSKHNVAVSNGTTGLHLAYLTAGIGPGDAVIVPAITFAATSNAVLYCGAMPVFADIDPETYCISSKSIERCIEIARNAGLNVRAIAPVHYAGRPCEMKSILEIADRYQLVVIEDACHALGAEYRPTSLTDTFQRVGSASSNSMAVFSFHPVKHITTGEGGMVTTSNPEYAAKLRLLRAHGITKISKDFKNKNRATTDLKPNPWYHEMQYLGVNYRLCDIQAALGESQLQRIEMFVARRRQIASRYNEAFHGIPHLKSAPQDSEFSKHSYHLFPLRIDFANLGVSRAAFMQGLQELGVGSQVHYIPVPWHPYYEDNRGRWLADDLPESKKFYEQELSIPMFSKMSDDNITTVIHAIKKLLTK